MKAMNKYQKDEIIDAKRFSKDQKDKIIDAKRFRRRILEDKVYKHAGFLEEMSRVHDDLKLKYFNVVWMIPNHYV